MARPLKQIVDYFPHFANHGKTLLIIRNEFGNDGYAFWYCTLELLCKSDGQFYDYNKPADWRLLLAETGVSEEKALAILKTLAELEAIDVPLYTNKIIWSQNLVDNLEQVYDRRATGKPEKPSLCQQKPLPLAINVNNNKVNVNNNPASKQNNTIQDNTNIYSHWNSKNIIIHKTITEKLAKKIKTVLKEHTEEEIIKAIDNYAAVLSDSQSYFKHKWTLIDFLQRGLEKFIDSASPLINFKKDGLNGKNRQNSRELPKHFTSPEEFYRQRAGEQPEE